MKVSEAFNIALHLASEDSGEMYRPFVISSMNQILADLRYLTEGETVFTVSQMEEDIPLPNELCAEAVPYGLAVYLMLGDDEYSKSGFFDSRYAEAQNKYALTRPATFMEVQDVY